MLLAGLALAGCGSGSDQAVTSAPTSAIPSEPPSTAVDIPTPTPSSVAPPPAPAPLLSGTTSVKDDLHYTWDVSYEIDQIGPAQKDISDEPPGMATLILPVAGSLNVTYTTPGRNEPASGGPQQAQIGGLYKKSGAWCHWASFNTTFRLKHGASGHYCYRQLMSTTPTGTGYQARIQGVPEDDFDAIARDLAKPAYFIVSAAGVTSDRGDACVWSPPNMFSDTLTMLASAPGGRFSCSAK